MSDTVITPDETWLVLDTRPTYFGSAIKALGDGVVEGDLVPFTSPERLDLHNQFFDNRTNLYLADYPLDGLKTMYQHGLDATLGIKRNGIVVASAIKDAGAWVRAQLELHDDYQRAIYELVEKGVLSWSSGALPQSVRVAPDGHITDWAVIEASLTPTPAMPQLTRVHTLKSLVEDVLREARPIEVIVKASGVVTPTADEESLQTEDNSQDNEDTKLMDIEQIRQLIADRMAEAARVIMEELVNMLGGGAEPTPAEAETMTAYLEEEAAKQMGTEEEQKGLTRERFLELLTQRQPAIITAAVKRFNAEKQTARKNILAAARAGIDPQGNNTPANTVRTRTGGHDGGGGNGRGAPANIKMMRLKGKYSNLSPEVISYIFDTQAKYRRKAAMGRFRPGRSDEGTLAVMQVFADHVLEEQRKGLPRHVSPKTFAKAVEVSAIKANELDHTTQTNYGAEWVSTYWRDQIWERARQENVVLQQFQSVELQANVEEVPVEWTDPTVVFVPETTASAELDPSASPAGYSKIGTNKVQFAAKKLMLQVAWSAEEDEDSIIRFSEQAQKQSTRSMQNGIDNVLINGDTSSSGNINLDGGTPGATSKYLAFDGLIHLALVTGTGLKIDASGAKPLLSDIRAARFSMGREFNTDVDNIVVFTHTEAYQQALGLDEYLTNDKAGDLATNRKGQLGVLDGSSLLLTAQMVLSAANGKVSSTANLNTFGRFLWVYTPYFKVGFRRQVRTVLNQTLDGEAWVLTMSTRLDMKTHPENNGASLLYDLATGA